MHGKTVLITGSTDGVGRYVAAKLAAAGATVLIHGRDRDRAKSLTDDIRRQGHGETIFYQADLSSLAGARQLAGTDWPITSGSMSSSAMPGSDRVHRDLNDGPVLTDTNCGSP